MGVAAGVRVGLVGGGDRPRVPAAVRALRDRAAPAGLAGDPVPGQCGDRRLSGARPPRARGADGRALVKAAALVMLLLAAPACTSPIDAGATAPADAGA